MSVQTLTANVQVGETLYLVREDGTVLQVLPNTSLPGTVFYQTVIDTDGNIYPEQPNLEFRSSDFIPSDDPAVNATRIRLKNPVPTPGTNGDVLGVVGGLWADTQVQPFKATYYVDPSFSGTSVGSESNPFTTIAAAFAAMLALGLTAGIVRIPPGVTVTENVVFPATGTDWEIATDVAYFGNTNGARITGTVTANNATAVGCSYRLTRLIVNGAISGNSSNSAAGVQLFIDRCRCTSTLTLTTSAGGIWVTKLFGAGVADEAKWQGSIAGAVSIASDISASNWTFDGSVTYAQHTATFGVGAFFQNCWFNAGGITDNSVAGAPTKLTDCAFGTAVTYTSTNGTTLQVDGASMASLMSVGLTLAGATTTFSTINSNIGPELTLTGNVGAQPFGGRNVEGFYECLVSNTLLATGTNGLLQGNVRYTDMTGTLVTVPVGGALDISGAVGTKSEGALRFRHNGAPTPIAYSFTGIVTPGAMSVASAIAIRRVN